MESMQAHALYSGNEDHHVEFSKQGINRSMLEPASPSKFRGRAILSEEKVQAIFKSRPASQTFERYAASMIAKAHRVSIKTIRDIWIGRTWYRSTAHLDPSKPISIERLEKKPGRPKGAKDAKPRTRKWYKRALQDENSTEKDLESPRSSQGSPVQEGVSFGATCQLVTPSVDLFSRGMALEMEIFGNIVQELRDPFHEDWSSIEPGLAEISDILTD